MKKRNFVAGFAVLGVCSFLVIAAGAAPASANSNTTVTNPCTVTSVTPFTETGIGNIADILQVNCGPANANALVTINGLQIYNGCNGKLSWWASTTSPGTFSSGSVFEFSLNGIGAETVAVWGGPGCAARSYQFNTTPDISPYSSVTTKFKVNPPEVTTRGLKVFPSSEPYDSDTGNIAAILYAKYNPVFDTYDVNFSSDGLFYDCSIVNWYGPEEGGGPANFGSGDGATNFLDADGNTWVVALGSLCNSASVSVEADLATAPYKQYDNVFNITSP